MDGTIYFTAAFSPKNAKMAIADLQEQLNEYEQIKRDRKRNSRKAKQSKVRKSR